VIGISLAFGLCVYFIPGAYSGVHPWLKPVFSSALSVTTIMALILNLIFRIGVAEKARLELNPAAFSPLISSISWRDREGTGVHDPM